MGNIFAAGALHEYVHRKRFIANSVHFPVRWAATLRMRDATGVRAASPRLAGDNSCLWGRRICPGLKYGRQLRNRHG